MESSHRTVAMLPLMVSLARPVMRKRPVLKSACMSSTPFLCKCRMPRLSLQEPPSHVGPIGVALAGGPCSSLFLDIRGAEAVMQCATLAKCAETYCSYCSVMCSISAMHGQMQCNLSRKSAYISQLLATPTLRVLALTEALHRGILGTHCSAADVFASCCP